MVRRPGTPRLLRELNDRAALDLLLSAGPLTRAQLGELTGLSKVTASQMLARLEGRGLVEVVGEQAGGRGPNAALYAVVPSCAYVAALDVRMDRVTAGISDITGHIVSEVSADPNGGADPVKIVHDAAVKAARSAQVSLPLLRSVVIGTPGMVDPRTGDIRFSFDLPSWHDGVREALHRDLRLPVTIENDVNLAALAERRYGAARGVDDFALLWVGRGLGLAVMLGGRIHRGLTGGAGEIGYLPVPGAPLPETVDRSQAGELTGAFQSIVSAKVVRELAARHGIDRPTAGACVAAAVGAGDGRAEPPAEAFLDELAGRLAIGVASVCVLLDPGLVVLGGDVGWAGGPELTGRIERVLAGICPNQARIAVTEVAGNPVLRGGIVAALDHAREEVFSGATT